MEGPLSIGVLHASFCILYNPICAQVWLTLLPRSYSPCTPLQEPLDHGACPCSQQHHSQQPRYGNRGCSPKEEWTKKMSQRRCILMSHDPLITLHSLPRGPQAFLLVIQGGSIVSKKHSDFDSRPCFKSRFHHFTSYVV